MNTSALDQLKADLIAFARRYRLVSLIATVLGLLLSLEYMYTAQSLFGFGLYGLLKSLVIPGDGSAITTRAAVQKRLLKLSLITVAAFVGLALALMLFGAISYPEVCFGIFILTLYYAFIVFVVLAALYERTMRRIPKPERSEGAAGGA